MTDTVVATQHAPRKIIIDCDPGHDDAIAILLAHGSPAVELLAITTVAGNQTLEKVTRNAQIIATFAGIHGVPIAAGCGRPLVREPFVAAHIHGETGLDGPTLPEPTVPLDDRHAVDLIIELVMSHEPGAVTLVPTAPLTNIALAIRKQPAIIERVREVVLMGGGDGFGNITAAAEFNIAVDPEAAQAVFAASWKVTMVGIDTTHQVPATAAVRQRIREVDTESARMVDGMLEFYTAAYAHEYRFIAPPVHDPVTVAAVIDPGLLITRPAHVEVELAGTHTTGMTVCDFYGRDGAELRTAVAHSVDAERFWDLVIAALGHCD